MINLTEAAIALLHDLISIQSFSSEEDPTAKRIEQWFVEHEIPTKRENNNVYAFNAAYDPSKPTLLLNSHHDTVKPNSAYTKDPFHPHVEDGKLYGRIERLLLPEDQGKLCTNCTGKDKDQPIEGLIIVDGLSKDGDEWTDGDILDPGNGKSYDCTIKLDDANTLNVRGFLGFSFLGRTQIWQRKI